MVGQRGAKAPVRASQAGSRASRLLPCTTLTQIVVSSTNAARTNSIAPLPLSTGGNSDCPSCGALSPTLSRRSGDGSRLSVAGSSSKIDSLELCLLRLKVEEREGGAALAGAAGWSAGRVLSSGSSMSVVGILAGWLRLWLLSDNRLLSCGRGREQAGLLNEMSTDSNSSRS